MMRAEIFLSFFAKLSSLNRTLRPVKTGLVYAFIVIGFLNFKWWKIFFFYIFSQNKMVRLKRSFDLLRVQLL